MWDRIALYGGAALIAAGMTWYTWIREPVPSMQNGVTKVIELASRGAFPDARLLIDRLTNEHPQDPRGPLLLAWIEDGVKHYDQAQKAYQRALKLCASGDQKRHILLCMADIDRRRGRLQQARQRLQEAIKAHGPSRRSRWLEHFLRPHNQSRAIGKTGHQPSLPAPGKTLGEPRSHIKKLVHLADK